MNIQANKTFLFVFKNEERDPDYDSSTRIEARTEEELIEKIAKALPNTYLYWCSIEKIPALEFLDGDGKPCLYLLHDDCANFTIESHHQQNKEYILAKFPNSIVAKALKHPAYEKAVADQKRSDDERERKRAVEELEYKKREVERLENQLKSKSE